MTKNEKVVLKVAGITAALIAGLWAFAWMLNEWPARRLCHLFPGMPWEPRDQIWRTYVLLLWHDHAVQWSLLIGAVATAIVYWLWRRRSQTECQLEWQLADECRQCAISRQNKNWERYFSQ